MFLSIILLSLLPWHWHHHKMPEDNLTVYCNEAEAMYDTWYVPDDPDFLLEAPLILQLRTDLDILEATNLKTTKENEALKEKVNEDFDILRRYYEWTFTQHFA